MGETSAEICKTCGHKIPRTSRRCDECGQEFVDVRAEAADSTPDERRLVTIFFADLKGSMEIAKRLGAEEMLGLMKPVFELVAQAVARFDGTVQQYTGDGVMAIFGSPVAHEDHAHRACRAALLAQAQLRPFAAEVRRKSGVDLVLRIGLNSGEVVVGRVGDAIHSETTAQGHPVGLAARMEKLAPLNSIALAPSTAALVFDTAQLRDLGRMSVKGGSEPLHVFELCGMREPGTRLDAARARGLTRFIGRDVELASIAAAFTAAGDGRGSALVVVGDAGIGKSRVCFEFVERCRARGVPVYTANCASHTQAVPFAPVLELLRDCFGLSEREPATRARARILAALAPLAPDLETALPTLFDFLGLADPERPAPAIDPAARQRQIVALLISRLQRCGAGGPVVVLVDDLHWVDAASAGFLSEVVTGLPDTRILLLGNQRDEAGASWVENSGVDRIPLAPLDPISSTSLTKELLGASISLNKLAHDIVDRTAGNPFFIEEVVRSVLESGDVVGAVGERRLANPAHEIEIPNSVQAVVAARIDRLDSVAKELLRAAAVVGRRFADDVLAAVVQPRLGAIEEPLRRLCETGLLAQAPVAGERAHEFHHPLTHEVAYRFQLAARRIHVHADVARALETRYADRLDENAARIAYHWEHAHAPLAAAVWSSRAARWAGVVNARACLHHWRKVRKLLDAVPESEEYKTLGLRARVQILNLGWRLGLPEREAEALFQEGKQIASLSGDTAFLAMIANLYVANIQASLGRSPRRAGRLLSHAREAWRLAGASDDAGVQLAVHVNRIYSLYLVGDLKAATLLVGRALASPPADHRLGAEMYGFSPILWIGAMSGLLQSYMGHPRDGSAPLRDAIESASRLGEIENRGWAEGFCVTQAWALGDAASALEHAESAVAIANETGSGFSRILAYEALGLAHLVDGAWQAATHALETAFAIGRTEQANRFEEPRILALQAEALLKGGDAVAASERAAESIAAARRQRAMLYECHAQMVRATALLERDGTASVVAVREALGRAWRLANRSGASTYKPFLCEQRAALAFAVGEERRGLRALEATRRGFKELGAERHALRIARKLHAEGSV